MKSYLPFFFFFCSLIILPGISYGQDHLLLSEITLSPDSGEFIEIYNPTTGTVALDNYYLADNNEYALVPSGTTNVINSDFIVRFPGGSTILPNQVLTIALKGDIFAAYFGIAPDLEILSLNAAVSDMITVNVGTAPTLTNGGEGVVLFYWDGSTDLVADVDIMNAGIPTAANQIVSKTGISVDGPDADANTSTYLSDAGTMPLQLSAPGIGFSTKRIHLEGNNEILTGGNGITGNDETSENTAVTWDSSYTSPTPGVANIITGINNVSVAEKISLYPNPTDDELFIPLGSTGVYEIKLFSVTGSLLYYEIVHPGLKTHQLDLGDFSPGLYFLYLNTGESMLTEKIIIR